MSNEQTTITIPMSEYGSMQTEIKMLNEKIEWFILQQKLLHRRLYGSSSEKSAHEEQINLFNEAEATADVAAQATPIAAEPELTEAIAPYRRRKRLINDKENLPEDIPVEVIEHSLPQGEQICPECGEALHPIGQETTREELVTIPAHLVVRKHVCTAYGCRCCDKTGIKTPILKSSAPAPVIKGSFASPESVAHVMCEKFVIGTPLYRQEQYWNRKGICYPARLCLIG